MHARVATSVGACEGDGVSFLSTAVRQVLEHGRFCAVATDTAHGPHCTPLVFASSGGRLWITTSRRSAKTRAWKSDPSVAGLVRHGDLSVTFTGGVKLYDALDRNTWSDAITGATSIARATGAFSAKNARFFAGYAIDAKQVPFAWTPPGRVFVGIDIDRVALVDDEGVQEGKGRWRGETTSHAAFRRTSRAQDAFDAIPPEVRRPLGMAGPGALTLVGDRGPVVLPVRWRLEEHALYASLPAETLALADAGPDAPAALMVDRASAWRAREMVGAMVQGTASLYVVGELGNGGKTAGAIAAEMDPEADALVRIAPTRLVWWRGWSSGSASA
jgi:Pyridoxamine 5'-phosphate oxidase